MAITITTAMVTITTGTIITTITGTDRGVLAA
jgi:hypothetical protein